MNEIYKEIYTEKCPKCYIPISKNGGCMHMTCSTCKYEFCWMCKQPNDNHNDLSCFWGIYSKISFLIFTFLFFGSSLSKFGCDNYDNFKVANDFNSEEYNLV